MDQAHQRDDGSRRAAAVRALAERHAGQCGPLLPVLHAVVADVLNLSRAEVHGVVSFYHDFRRSPPPEHEIRLCRGEACQAVGAEELAAQVRAAYAGEEDVEVAEVFCLGNCALGPSGLVDGRLLGRLSRDRIDAVLTAPVTVGP
jgi:formate dehydrogenase subunit gamma